MLRKKAYLNGFLEVNVSLLDYFRSEKKNSASLAKERLQIIVAHERSQRGTPDYLPQLKQDILDVIRKYVNVNTDAVQVQFDQNEDDLAVLELNVTLPDEEIRTLSVGLEAPSAVVENESRPGISLFPAVASTEESI